MSIDAMVPCPCGSGQMSWWELDGYGIPLCRVCDACREAQLKRYRPNIKAQYDCEEPIEPDY